MIAGMGKYGSKKQSHPPFVKGKAGEFPGIAGGIELICGLTAFEAGNLIKMKVEG